MLDEEMRIVRLPTFAEDLVIQEVDWWTALYLHVRRTVSNLSQIAKVKELLLVDVEAEPL